MGRSGGRSAGRSGGGRSGGSRSSGRSASRSFSSSASRSFSSSASRGFSTSSSPKGGRPMSGYVPHKSMGGYEPRKTTRQPIHSGSYRGGFGGGLFSGGGLFGSGNIFVNVDNHQETYTNPTPVADTSTVYTESQQTVYTSTTNRSATAKKGCLTSIIAVIIWMVLISGIFSWLQSSSTGESGYAFTKSTVNRDKLNLNLSDAAGYYTDECGWIRNSTTLTNGLKDFYDSTGILPYVYIIDNVDGDYDPSTEKLEQFAADKYAELFNDNGHILLVFWDFGGAYEYTLWLGEDTLEVMDSEACDILFDYLDYYYYYAETEEEFFADAFADAGERMMTVTRSAGYYIIRIVIVAAVIYAIYYFVKKNKEKEAERKRRAEEILNSPLEKFGDNGDIIDDLEKKYEKEI